MWRVVGHPGAVRLLDRSLSEGRLAHAYLFTGPQHVGKSTLATDLIAAVNCEGPEPPCGECSQCAHVREGRHADLVQLGVAEEEGRKAIGIDAVRDAAHQANLNPFEGRYRAIVIEGAEHLTEEAANALLKLIVECGWLGRACSTAWRPTTNIRQATVDHRRTFVSGCRCR